MDIDNIPFGKDFRAHIREAIVQSDILLVVVGRGWLGAGRGGARRIASETDFVRFEVETALSTGIPVIPVLVGSAKMPQPVQLPESLKNFAFLNAAPVDTGRDFHQHMERLIRGIDQIPDRPVTRPSTTGSSEKVAAQPSRRAVPDRPRRGRRPMRTGGGQSRKRDREKRTTEVRSLGNRMRIGRISRCFAMPRLHRSWW
jgi:hypothetical protein